MSEKANDLLNKFGSAQFDFMIWNTPDNLVARDKARQEISDYIAELEAEIAKMKKYFHKPAHGTCCTCQKCGHTYDECRCDFDEALDDLDKANARIAELEAAQRWHVVADGELPEVDEEVIVCDESGHRREDWLVCKQIDGVGETLFYSAAYDYDTPTHWMPFPKLPEVQE